MEKTINIEANKAEFIEILRELTIDGADVDGLIAYLEASDFFTAPASTQYHNAVAGGLCDHSLHVYKILCNLVADYDKASMIDDNSLIVAGLLHELASINYYELTTKNKKVYHEAGTKHDNMGNYSWFSEEGYRIKDPENRMLAGTHAFNTMMIISKFIPLSDEEAIAIINQTGGADEPKQSIYDLPAIYNAHTLAALLHCADFLAAFVLEKY